MKLKSFFAVFAFVMAFCVNANAQFLDSKRMLSSENKPTNGTVDVCTDWNLWEYLNTNQEVVLFFYAQWSGPSKLMDPIVSRVAERNPYIKFIKADCDDCPHLVEHYHIPTTPTFLFFKNQSHIGTIVGMRDEFTFQSLVWDMFM